MGATILIVDDEEIVGLHLQAALADAGFDTQFFAAAEPALASLATSQFAAAILDVGLPGLAGNELAHQLRVRCPGLPIVLATGYDETVYRAEFEHDVQVSVMSKPFEEPELLSRLQALGVISTR